MANLQIKNLSKSYEDTNVLDNLNLNIIHGEFLVLVGPSGSGKSTILRVIAGLEQPTAGEILIDSKVVNNLHPKDRDIAMVFQNYALYPHMSVYENLAFPLSMRKMNSKQIQLAVNETAELLDIKHHLKKVPKDLSGGEKQRVALGRAIIRKPKLFLMDEPLSNLDAKLRIQMRAELLKLHRSLSTTFVYVTHDQIEALTMGNRIVVLDRGKIQQVGTPQEIYTKPANLFVAGFVGSPTMNFFNFKVIDDSHILFDDQPLELKLNNDILKVVYEKKLFNIALVLGIRPEHLDLASTGGLIIKAIIEFIEMHGHEYLIYATLKNSNNKTSISIKDSGSLNLKPSEEINVLIDLNKAHYFDKTTGVRINL